MSETGKKHTEGTRLDKLQLFEGKEIRSVWVEEAEDWYFSVVDVVGVLTDTPNPRNYWKVLKHRLKEEGSQLVTECNQLKMKSPKDGKYYQTDAGSTEQILRLVQSIGTAHHAISLR